MLNQDAETFVRVFWLIYTEREGEALTLLNQERGKNGFQYDFPIKIKTKANVKSESPPTGTLGSDPTTSGMGKGSHSYHPPAHVRHRNNDEESHATTSTTAEMSSLTHDAFNPEANDSSTHPTTTHAASTMPLQSDVESEDMSGATSIWEGGDTEMVPPPSSTEFTKPSLSNSGNWLNHIRQFKIIQNSCHFRPKQSPGEKETEDLFRATHPRYH